MNMTAIKTSELSGAQLDWAVAVLCGEYKTAHAIFPTMTLDPRFNGAFLCPQHGEIRCFLEPLNPMRQDPQHYSPSTDWAIGGLIIEREVIDVDGNNARAPHVKWRALTDSSIKNSWGLGQRVSAFGQTALIAAMRAFVSSRIGDTVEVPV